jgi:nucleoid-associated protein YgaU
VLEEVAAVVEETVAMEEPVAEAAPAEEAPPAESPGPEIYVVQSGDSLSAIAQRLYGDANAYTRIFEANRDKISDPNLIHPGQELVIPR